MSNVQHAAYRRPLNHAQIKLLQWLYLFRFSTSKQLATRLGSAHQKAIQKRLQILEAQGLIGKRYGARYKLAGKPAEYYLTARGAKYTDEPHSRVIKSLYRNTHVSEGFVRHNVHIADVALKLLELYPKKVDIYTAASLMEFDSFPTWRPDLTLRLVRNSEPTYAFMDIWDESKPFFVQVRKARNYLTYINEGGLPSDFSDKDPLVLFICEDQKQQQKLNRQIRRLLYDEALDEPTFATTTREQLHSATSPHDPLWLLVGVDEPPEPATLESLI